MKFQCHLFTGVWSMWALSLAVIVVVGCGGPPADVPPLGEVTGRVTLDGKPLANAAVVFSPADKRDSMGTTDENGEYTLLFARQLGATIGKHTVRITKGAGGPAGEHAEGEQKDAAEPAEAIPAKYNTESTLTADVKPGSNTFDFNLESEPGAGKSEPKGE